MVSNNAIRRPLAYREYRLMKLPDHISIVLTDDIHKNHANALNNAVIMCVIANESVLT